MTRGFRPKPERRLVGTDCRAALEVVFEPLGLEGPLVGDEHVDPRLSVLVHVEGQDLFQARAPATSSSVIWWMAEAWGGIGTGGRTRSDPTRTISRPMTSTAPISTTASFGGGAGCLKVDDAEVGGFVRVAGHGPSLKRAPAASGAEIPSKALSYLAPITTCASVSEHKISDFQALVAQFCSEISASSAEPTLSFCPASQPHDHLLRADLATLRHPRLLWFGLTVSITLAQNRPLRSRLHRRECSPSQAVEKLWSRTWASYAW